MAHGEIDKLAEALSKAQGTMLPAGLNSTNPFFKSKYADLGSIIAAAKKPMADNGLSVVQLVETPEGTVAVTTILMHLSGQSISATVTLPITEERGKSMAQVIASNATYLRRIGYAAMLGVCADEDSDGAQPAARPQATAQPKAQAPATTGQPVNKTQIKTGKWADAVKELGAMPYYQAKDGTPDTYHMLGAAAKIGIAEITDANIAAVKAQLIAHAQAATAMAATENTKIK